MPRKTPKRKPPEKKGLTPDFKEAVRQAIARSMREIDANAEMASRMFVERYGRHPTREEIAEVLRHTKKKKLD
jgi:DNA-directed RNA polymerase specialized sigma subunit